MATISELVAELRWIERSQCQAAAADRLDKKEEEEVEENKTNIGGYHG